MPATNIQEPHSSIVAEFANALHNDLNIAEAIAWVNTWVGSTGGKSASDASVFRLLDDVLGVLSLERPAAAHGVEHHADPIRRKLLRVDDALQFRRHQRQHEVQHDAVVAQHRLHHRVVEGAGHDHAAGRGTSVRRAARLQAPRAVRVPMVGPQPVDRESRVVVDPDDGLALAVAAGFADEAARGGREVVGTQPALLRALANAGHGAVARGATDECR